MLFPVSVSKGFGNKIEIFFWVAQIKFFSLTVLGSTVWNQEIRKLVLSGGSKKEYIPCLFHIFGRFLVIFGIPCFVATALLSLSQLSHGLLLPCVSSYGFLLFVCLCTWFLFFLRSLDFKAHPNRVFCHLQLTYYICQDPISKECHILRFHVDIH
jgi:hypothetical protein